MFLLSGINKLQDFGNTVNGFMGKTGLTVGIAQIAIIAAAMLQLSGSSIIMYESYNQTSKYSKMACYGLAAFIVAATLIYHFPPTGSAYYPFISNVTTFGALLLLAEQF